MRSTVKRGAQGQQGRNKIISPENKERKGRPPLSSKRRGQPLCVCVRVCVCVAEGAR